MENKALAISYICMSQAQTFSVTGWILLRMGWGPGAITGHKMWTSKYRIYVGFKCVWMHHSQEIQFIWKEVQFQYTVFVILLSSKVEENIWFVVSWIQLLWCLQTTAQPAVTLYLSRGICGAGCTKTSYSNSSTGGTGCRYWSRRDHLVKKEVQSEWLWSLFVTAGVCQREVLHCVSPGWTGHLPWSYPTPSIRRQAPGPPPPDFEKHSGKYEWSFTLFGYLNRFIAVQISGLCAASPIFVLALQHQQIKAQHHPFLDLENKDLFCAHSALHLSNQFSPHVECTHLQKLLIFSKWKGCHYSGHAAVFPQWRYSCLTSPFSFLLIREYGLMVSSIIKSYRTFTQDVYWGRSV